MFDDNVEMEQKIIDTLKGTNMFKVVEPYQGDMELFIKSDRRMPAALLIYAGCKSEGVSRGSASISGHVQYVWTIKIIGKNLKGRSAQSEDVKPLLNAARNALNGLTLEGRTLYFEEEEVSQILPSGEYVYEQSYRYDGYYTAVRQ